jgi:hypothetical protein
MREMLVCKEEGCDGWLAILRRKAQLLATRLFSGARDLSLRARANGISVPAIPTSRVQLDSCQVLLDD